jgi:hypothetical protein
MTSNDNVDMHWDLLSYDHVLTTFWPSNLLGWEPTFSAYDHLPKSRKPPWANGFPTHDVRIMVHWALLPTNIDPSSGGMLFCL